MKKHIAFLSFLLFYLGYHLYKTVKYIAPFFDWDESIYAQVGKEMIRSKSFLVPLWQGMPWLDKPPLPSLLYGIAQIFPIPAEISTRIVTLLVSLCVLCLLYILILRITSSVSSAFLTVFFTSFLPLFDQRSLALNVDVFLLTGWFGYLVSYNSLIGGTLFLLVGVLSKSLLGFYPPILMLCYLLFLYARKKYTKKQLIGSVKQIGIQIGVSSLWFIGMALIYKNDFIQYHFIDSHMKRVTASIEQHFGQRTFYADVLIEQIRFLILPAVVSSLYYVYFFVQKPENRSYLFALFFLPWFVFLNLTKTKIAWYLYPVLPQFIFLSVYPLSFLHKNRLVYYSGIAVFCLLFFLFVSPPKLFFTAQYSQWEDHQYIALSAKAAGCKQLFILVNQETRTSYATLKSMNLVITTTTWWGNHPSIAYYSDAKTYSLYTLEDVQKKERVMNEHDCLVVEKRDTNVISKLKLLKQPVKNATYELYTTASL